ncbi:universal stress protein UspA [Acetobacter indonesiensis NRIC 0313]|uniref:Universal stress protein UspA n=1 Tax=Acetobacter indonesiensis TaxID=104101 RepID=A0A252AVK9_9PROT|nr:universal stress protein [Acetobacter indonesiensis]OUI94309.1 universal stress protein UspA [Acetobacter indonesiensis]GAN63841.1 universal stress protein UspA [Acetobacter indonesiensis]GBQ59607.1 universal stress protein UspA [Acetobacter indonesiensis NRIC 0313]GEN02657.1 universal stress protein UspA [Acetobacter indonesiensis]
MKDVRKILLPLPSVSNGEAALIRGYNFARRFGAHLAVLHVRPDGRDIAPMAGEGLSGAMVEDLMRSAEHESARHAREVHKLFEQFAATHPDIQVVPPRSPFPWDQPSMSFNIISGAESEIVPAHARLSDFTLVPHPDSGEEVSSSETLHAVLFDSGRPVVIAPRTPPQGLIKRVCIGWNGTAESSSALRGALAWALTAEAVRVLHCEDYQRRGPKARDVIDYLSFHGIKADAVAFNPVDRDVGKGLLAACKDFDADMLAMGAYSHSRLRQLILGGVTRHVLEHADLTVLMSR